MKYVLAVLLLCTAFVAQAETSVAAPAVQMETTKEIVFPQWEVCVVDGSASDLACFLVDLSEWANPEYTSSAEIISTEDAFGGEESSARHTYDVAALESFEKEFFYGTMNHEWDLRRSFVYIKE